MKLVGKVVIFFIFFGVLLTFYSCQKKEQIEVFPYCPYIEQSDFAPSDVNFNDGVWTTIRVNAFYNVLCRIDPKDSTDIEIYLSKGVCQGVYENHFLFSLTAAKREVAKAGRRLPTAEEIHKIFTDLKANGDIKRYGYPVMQCGLYAKGPEIGSSIFAPGVGFGIWSDAGLSSSLISCWDILDTGNKHYFTIGLDFPIWYFAPRHLLDNTSTVCLSVRLMKNQN